LLNSAVILKPYQHNLSTIVPWRIDQSVGNWNCWLTPRWITAVVSMHLGVNFRRI